MPVLVLLHMQVQVYLQVQVLYVQVHMHMQVHVPLQMHVQVQVQVLVQCLPLARISPEATLLVASGGYRPPPRPATAASGNSRAPSCCLEDRCPSSELPPAHQCR